jgi:hypothetical protein
MNKGHAAGLNCYGDHVAEVVHNEEIMLHKEVLENMLYKLYKVYI